MSDLRQNFLAQYLGRGGQYQREGRVGDISRNEDGLIFTAIVRGSGANQYKVYIKLHKSRHGTDIDGVCTCPIGDNCKHVAATLLQALQSEQTMHNKVESNRSQNLNDWDRWFSEIDQTVQKTGVEELPGADTHLLYILDLSNTQPYSRLTLETVSARLLKGGQYGKHSHYNPRNLLNFKAARYLLESDIRILRELNLDFSSDVNGRIELSGDSAAELLTRILATHRCHWQRKESKVLKLGARRVGKWEWELEDNGEQKLTLTAEPQASFVLPLTPPWYFDANSSQCGPIDSDLPDQIAIKMLNSPTLPVQKSDKTLAKLSNLLSNYSLPTPKSIRAKQISGRAPTPCLFLHQEQIRLDINPSKVHQSTRNRYWQTNDVVVAYLARLEFDYVGQRVAGRHNGEAITYAEHGQLIALQRDAEVEAKHIQRLYDTGLVKLSDGTNRNLQHDRNVEWKIGTEMNVDEAIEFSLYQIPQLRAERWKIEIEPNYPFNFVDNPEQWYADLDEQSGNDWFSLELGIDVDGKRINLLPLLVQALEQYDDWYDSDWNESEESPGSKHTLLALEDGRMLPIPTTRLRQILTILVELNTPHPLDRGDRLRLAAIQAAQLAELNAAMGENRLTWSGGEQLLALGEQLRNFEGIKPVSPPLGLNAQLRNYQQAGLDWLQFLREHNLSGILADDMGLGKTVQTLAHILIEKRAGRLTKPCLVVAPTSLMVNWRLEANRFTPDLKVLTLHGPQRKNRFDQMAKHDIVLTTYPLLPRDSQPLLAQQYHLVVLDEAQVVKNPKAKAAVTVRQFDARHRLCLTGTPMENHLGELWALFDFLLPGLLGDERRFRQLFRHPIEKQGDQDRQLALSKRIAPFILRRTKDQVALDLPEKTEIKQNVELDSAQRDLYESVRLTMHEKVRSAISEKGFERNHILILDALLKLRQVCCDPRLVKLDAAKLVRQSSKLDALMDMLPEMVEEGRRILLFSQFTSMLSLIEAELNKLDLSYVKLTGQTRDRVTPIEQFQSGRVPIFLISLKAGGTGLNLTTADTVIHYDPWWNPAVEQQATDRAHRIGQDKAVFVYKLIALGTVEEKMLELQEKKKLLADGIYSGQSKDKSTLTQDDLDVLFQPLDA